MNLRIKLFLLNTSLLFTTVCWFSSSKSSAQGLIPVAYNPPSTFLAEGTKTYTVMKSGSLWIPPIIMYTLTGTDSDTYSWQNGNFVVIPSDSLTAGVFSIQSAGVSGSSPTPSFQGTSPSHEMKWNLIFAGKTTAGTWYDMWVAHDHPVQGEQADSNGVFKSVDADKFATQKIVTVLSKSTSGKVK